MKNFLSILFVLVAFAAIAQNGTVRGTVIDDSNGEPIMFGDVIVEGTTTGTSTDLDGTFSLSLEPGTYNIVVSYVGYSDYTAKDVVVAAGGVNALGTIRMKDETVSMDLNIVVEAKAIKNSDNALLTIQRKSANVVDAISAQTFSRVGDGNAAAAIKRVTGVSIEGGKHVFVRGLGDRYTKTLLNGMSIPGLDPDKNSVQMDIFPTNLLDNISVFKTFTPNLPGDFTGGTVDISLKDFPEEETFSVSAGLGFNPNMHFKKDFLTYKGGKLDFLGFDDGTRKLPYDGDIPNEQDARNSPVLGNLLTTVTKSFNPEMGVSKKQNLLDGNFGVSYGNQINKENVTFGYTVAANYSGSSEDYSDVVVARYIKRADRADNRLRIDPSRDNQDFSKKDVLWSALASGALKFKTHKLKLGVFRSQNATATASIVTTVKGDDNPATLYKENLEYIQRSVTNTYVGGEHKFGKKGKVELDWTVAPTFSVIDEPDNRYTAYEVVTGSNGEKEYYLRQSVGGGADRVFRDLNQTNISSKADLTWKPSKKAGKIKFGLANTYKTRDYSIQTKQITAKVLEKLTGNPNEFLAEGNVWTRDNTEGTFYVQGNYEAAKTYDARQNINAAYAMHEYKLNDQWKFIYGARLEQFTSWYTGVNAGETVVFDDKKVLDKYDLLPSLNIVYSVVPDKMNIRASYSRTVARPSFREVSTAQIEDRLSGVEFYGNVDIKTTTIDNADLRWEYYFDKGEIAAVSAFYKSFQNPIEIAVLQQSGNFYRSDIITPYNGGETKLYGAEVEFRKNLGFIADAIKGMSWGANLSYVQSSVKMTETELAIRKDWARNGETIKSTRQLVGQAPFIINTYLNFANESNTTEANISYNVQGKRLKVIGLGEVPDLYENPFHSLNFKLSQKFGSDNRWKGSISVKNILGQKKEDVYTSYGVDDTTYRLISPGTSFSLGISYKIK